MQVPKLLYGDIRDVKQACRSMVAQLRGGAAWDDVAGELVDSRAYPGLLLIDGPRPLTGRGEHFHFFAPVHLIAHLIPGHRPQLSATLFEPALVTSWGFLTLLCHWARPFLRPAERQKQFLHALLRHWNDCEALGPRYTRGSQYGKPLWQLPTNIQYCLIRQGLPPELCAQPVPTGGMIELVAQTRAGLPADALS